MTDTAAAALLLEHARAAVHQCQAYHAAVARHRRELETEGWRLTATDGENGQWMITDYRTGQVLASGDGPAGSTWDRLDAETAAAGGRGIYDIERADEDAPEAGTLLGPPPPPEGIPPGLADAIAGWAETAAERGDQEAMRFLGLSLLTPEESA